MNIFFCNLNFKSLQVLHEFHELQEMCGIIPEENGFHEYPAFYSFIDVECHEAILLEDLKERSYEMLEYRDYEVTYDHAHLAMTALGKYHAMSFAMKDKQPDKFKNIIAKFGKCFSEEMKPFYDNCESTIYKVVKNDDIVKKLKNKLGESLYAAVQATTNELKNGPCAVIGHGDFKINNMLFKYDKVVLQI